MCWVWFLFIYFFGCVIILRFFEKKNRKLVCCCLNKRFFSGWEDVVFRAVFLGGIGVFFVFLVSIIMNGVYG